MMNRDEDRPLPPAPLNKLTPAERVSMRRLAGSSQQGSPSGSLRTELVHTSVPTTPFLRVEETTLDRRARP